ncbi:hypothetical protein B0H17DRAFT_1140927 [Mycena rosella]|uniref:Uncharacterized protein n=1 Tax=Mycena rosella TaxID=1033263 RepID=A0AAD7G6V7_MYCRO|nr:hypothetical protein B0H17DRAFT_1140927 [Mycena rosella]
MTAVIEHERDKGFARGLVQGGWGFMAQENILALRAVRDVVVFWSRKASKTVATWFRIRDDSDDAGKEGGESIAEREFPHAQAAFGKGDQPGFVVSDFASGLAALGFQEVEEHGTRRSTSGRAGRSAGVRGAKERVTVLVGVRTPLGRIGGPGKAESWVVGGEGTGKNTTVAQWEGEGVEEDEARHRERSRLRAGLGRAGGTANRYKCGYRDRQGSSSLSLNDETDTAFAWEMKSTDVHEPEVIITESRAGTGVGRSEGPKEIGLKVMVITRVNLPRGTDKWLVVRERKSSSGGASGKCPPGARIRVRVRISASSGMPLRKGHGAVKRAGKGNSLDKYESHRASASERKGARTLTCVEQRKRGVSRTRCTLSGVCGVSAGSVERRAIARKNAENVCEEKRRRYSQAQGCWAAITVGIE